MLFDLAQRDSESTAEKNAPNVVIDTRGQDDPYFVGAYFTLAPSCARRAVKKPR